MGFWDKVKDFVGIEDEYYDEDDYYEDDEYFDNEEIVPTSEENEEIIEQKEEKPVRSYRTQSLSGDTTRINTQNSTSSKSSNRSHGSSNMEVTIKEPLTYEDGKAVLDDIINGKTVVLNLEMLEMDKKTQIFYFVSGGLYSLRGSISNVTKDIYVLVPEGVQVDGKLTKAMTEKSLYQI